MADLSHIYGQGLNESAVGGLLLLVDGAQDVQQRVIRRLLTCNGASLLSPTGWAGLPTFIGEPARDRRIRAVVLKALRSEDGIDQSKPIKVEVYTDPATSTTMVRVQYTDKFSASGVASVVTVPLVQ